VEWDDELYRIPCTLTVEGDQLDFDFTGAAPPAPHFFNTKPYILKSGFLIQAAWVLAPDLPYTEGLLAPVSLRCPEGSIVNSVPPAPINAGHIHVAFTAAETMMQCLRMAVWASPDAERECPVSGLGSYSGLALTTWSGIGLDGVPDTWMLMDGTMGGTTAGDDRDGGDMGGMSVGQPTPAQVPDVEILESWYPMLIDERRVRTGLNGAGEHRSGGGNRVTFRPHGTDRLTGQMLGMRAYVPLEGIAGGLPGATTQLRILRRDGSESRVGTAAAGVVVDAGEAFQIRCSSGGGVGDPVRRDPAMVAVDVAEDRLSAAEAKEVYGVVLGDGDGADVDLKATVARRRTIQRQRLRRAGAATRPVDPDKARVPAQGDDVPLYPGVVQRGSVAVAARSGAPLAVAPDHWTDGCPVLEERRPGPGPAIVTRSYLDPSDGSLLHVEVLPEGTPRSFEVRPERWSR
jgi:N-methylhydantoinase B